MNKNVAIKLSGRKTERGSDKGVKKTIRNNNFSNAKIAIKTIENTNGKALIIIECLTSKKKTFSKMNNAEIR